MLAVPRLCNCSSVRANNCVVPNALDCALLKAEICVVLSLLIWSVLKSANTVVDTAAKSPASNACNLYSFKPLSWVAVMARTWLLLSPRI